MDYIIRDIREDEHPLLEEFLYQAIYVPEGFEDAISRSIVCEDPRCRAAYEGFGTRPDDRALVAETDGQVVGACWVRTTGEYGHIDDATPSFSISLLAPFRGQGIGTALMSQMLDHLRCAGYDRASLSVQKENLAVRLYERLGFRIVGNGVDDSEWLMVHELVKPFPIIETQRLILRPWLQSDAAALYALARDPEVGSAAGWPPHTSVENSLEVITDVFSAPETYAIVLKETGELVGCVGFNAGEAANVALADDELELGYWVGKPYWGRGIATEAAQAIVDRGFIDLGLSGIWAVCFDGNERSRCVLEKLGFTHVRTEHDVFCALLGESKTEHFMYLAHHAG